MAERHHPDSRGFARVELMATPTPLQPLPRLGEELGVDLWIKRDDLGATGMGGNKLRKLEFLLGEAIEKGCDTVVTFGAVQSNHARQTAAAAARLGMRCQLVLTRSVPRGGDLYTNGGNRLLDDLFGAEVTVCDLDGVDEAILSVNASLEALGARPAWIAPGGSEPVGVLGYVAAGHEMAGQLETLGLGVSDVVLATSTGGTHAGLLHGLASSHAAPSVHGVAVYHGVRETREAVALLGAGVAELLDEPPVHADAIGVDGAELGEGYGIPTGASREAQALFARTEGIVLDPVYTAKAAASLIRRCRQRETGRPPAAAQGRDDPARDREFGDGSVVFLHTGGAPGFFAYGSDALPG